MRGSAVAPHASDDRSNARRANGTRFDLKLREKLLVLIVVPLGVLLLLVSAVMWQSVQTRRASDATNRSTAALQSAQMVLETLVDAETGMRGYVLTGDKHLAKSYRAASESFRPRVAEFERASLTDPSLLAPTAAVVSSAFDSFSQIDRYVALVDARKVARARAEFARDSGQETLDRFRDTVALYKRADHAVEATMLAAQARDEASVQALLVFGTLLALATTATLYLTITRSLIRRLYALRARANAVAAGESPQIDIAGNDAITEVEQAFRDMAVLLDKREDALVRVSSLQSAILRATDHANVTTATDGTIMSFNRGAERMLGYTEQETVGHLKPQTFHLPGERATRTAAIDEMLAKPAAEQIAKLECTFVRKDGSHVPIAETLTPLRDVRGTILGYLSVAEDITLRRAAEHAVRQSELEQREYARQLRSLHLISNTVGTVQKDCVNDSLRLGLEQLGLSWAYIGIYNEDRTELIIDNSVSALGEASASPVSAGTHIPVSEAFIGIPPDQCEVCAVESLRGSGAYIAAPVHVSGSPYGAIGFIGSEPRSVPFSAANRDFVRVTADLVGTAIERQRQRAQLDSLAFFDALTGLPNRVLWLDRLTQTVLAARRYDEVFTVLYLDLDGFKAVNDSFGHGIGDKVLVAAARRFEKLMRESDTVARLGGDEFVILAPKLSASQDAIDLATRVVSAMSRPIITGGVGHSVSVSIGIAVFPHDGDDAGSLVDSADRALYAAKARGKNTFSMASDVPNDALRAHPIIANLEAVI